MSSPVMSGRRMSSSTASGCSLRMRYKASSPLLAMCAAYPACVSASLRNRAVTAVSSATTSRPLVPVSAGRSGWARGEGEAGQGEAGVSGRPSESAARRNRAVKVNTLPMPGVLESVRSPPKRRAMLRRWQARGPRRFRADRPNPGRRSLFEALEDAFLFVRGDAPAGVDDLEGQRAPPSGACDSARVTRRVTEPFSVNFTALPSRLPSA